ncbi:MAG TPA: hypothetical protein VGZ22_16870 [Isosphaeraceae bacterium]|nr:hypothetical protein [Isosphaeraceae bacterium]
MANRIVFFLAVAALVASYGLACWAIWKCVRQYKRWPKLRDGMIGIALFAAEFNFFLSGEEELFAIGIVGAIYLPLLAIALYVSPRWDAFVLVCWMGLIYPFVLLQTVRALP